MNSQRLHIDKTLWYALLALALVSLLVVYSASGKDLGLTGGHALRLLLGFGLMLAWAPVRVENFERCSPLVFAAGVGLQILQAHLRQRGQETEAHQQAQRMAAGQTEIL